MRPVNTCAPAVADTAQNTAANTDLIMRLPPVDRTPFAGGHPVEQAKCRCSRRRDAHARAATFVTSGDWVGTSSALPVAACGVRHTARVRRAAGAARIQRSGARSFRESDR